MTDPWQFESSTTTGTWQEAESPTSETHYDVCQTRCGPVVGGGSGFVVNTNGGIFKTSVYEGCETSASTAPVRSATSPPRPTRSSS